MVAAALGIGTLLVAVAVVSYLMSGETGLGAGQGVVERVTRYVPLQSAKIVIVSWQILTQVSGIVHEFGLTRRFVYAYRYGLTFPWRGCF